jgi:hypothetical protein
VSLSEKLSRSRIEILTHCPEVFGDNLAFESQLFSTSSVPLVFDGPILVVIATLLKMPLGIAFAAGRGTNRQRNPTPALFEIEIQGSCWIRENSTPKRAK